MLATAVDLHDVVDVERFVHAAISRTKLIVTEDEREELLSEGIVALYRLARKFAARPQRVGSRFSGFAAQRLPGKIIDAWHALHENHRRVQVAGARRWVYFEPAASLDALTDDHFGRGSLELTMRTRDFSAVPEAIAA